MIRYACLVALGTGALAADLFVSPSGLDSASRSGTMNDPWRTLAFAFDRVASGDTIFMRAGRYHEQVKRKKVQGTMAEPISVRAYGREQVTLDGTAPINSKWKRHAGNIYKTQLSQPVWQLFSGGKLMVNARWPNAGHDDGLIHTNLSWARGIKEQSRNGLLVDDPKYHDLAAAGIDASGAVMIANVHNWISYSVKVTSHAAGRGSFAFTEAKDYLTGGKKRYYFEGSLALLDRETEWHMDRKTNTLYFHAPCGGNPGPGVRGRIQDRAIDGDKWENVHFHGIDFFGTTVRFTRSVNVSFTTSNFYAPGASKRSLGVIGKKPSIIDLAGAGGFALRNCSVTYSESQGVHMEGRNNEVINCRFAFNDWAAAEGYFPMNAVSIKGNGRILHTTVFHSGSSETIGVAGPPGNSTHIEIGYVDITATGYAQTDGGLVSIGSAAVRSSVVHHNWLHEERKYGLRFDCPSPPLRFGVEGTSHHNVIWKTGGANPKGNQHRHLYNTIFNNEGVDMVVGDRSSESSVYYSNNMTTVANSAFDSISSHGNLRLPVLSTLDSNYDASEGSTGRTPKFTQAPVHDLLRDPDDHDFRPANSSVALVNAATAGLFDDIPEDVVDGTPDVGAYEYGATHYWMPGRAEWKPSKPIPSDRRSFTPADRDLIWHGAYEASEHSVFFGKSPDSLRLLRGPITNEDNIVTPNKHFAPSGQLPNGTYYWRVDAVVAGDKITGDVWVFAVGTNAPAAPPPARLACPDAGGLSLAGIIGIGIGALLFVFLLLGIGVAVWWVRRRRVEVVSMEKSEPDAKTVTDVSPIEQDAAVPVSAA